MLENQIIDSLDQDIQMLKIFKKSILSWLLFKWGKDVYDSEDKRIMTIEHSFLSKITHFRFPFIYSYVILTLVFFLFSILFSIVLNSTPRRFADEFINTTLPFIFFLYFIMFIFPIPLAILFRQKKYIVKDRNQKGLGIISTNWRKSVWRITDKTKKLMTTVYFTKDSYGKIVTSSGEYSFEVTFDHIYLQQYPHQVQINGMVTIDRISKQTLTKNSVDHFSILISSFKDENPFTLLTISFVVVEQLLDYSVGNPSFAGSSR